MKKALNLVKSIRKEGKISDIIFFRAKQTAKALPDRLVTLEVHNDGKVRIWFKRSKSNDKEQLKKELDSFIDKNSK